MSKSSPRSLEEAKRKLKEEVEGIEEENISDRIKEVRQRTNKSARNKELHDLQRRQTLKEEGGLVAIQDRLYAISVDGSQQNVPYDEDIFVLILSQIAGGRSLHTIIQDGREAGISGFPSVGQFYNRLKTEEGARERYTEARDSQVDAYADHIVHIADTCTDPAKAKLQIEVRKRIAAKLKPKVYGDRLEVNATMEFSFASLFDKAQERLGEANNEIIDMKEDGE